MWKIVLLLVVTALFILTARLAFEPRQPDLRIGSAEPVSTGLMYAGVRG